MTDSCSTSVGVFAKYWQPGRVKSRLAADVGEAAAAALSRVFLETTLDRVGGLAMYQEVCYSPADREAEFRAAVPPDWPLAPQIHGTLGERMEAFFERVFAYPSHRVVLIGSDTPNVPREYVASALDALQRADVVLGPARDGGYYLVGARQRTPPIFRGIPWSTPLVWQRTLQLLHDRGLHEGEGFAVLPPWYDVDTLDDLQKLRHELAHCSDERAAMSPLAAAIDQAVGSRGGCEEVSK